ncbi:membrane protein G74 [Wood mouse herpesvirus]|uniref:Membrane protein G74 n=1 Tax=Wood mouse herpesvirus TaxID=432370 RepID=D0U1R3_9GAMA|nr:membrane protein G74 [Wood mouse herpesvirus]ACY41143.1 membrane protein G74 [Wood mouse herpesvirus]
MFVLRDLDLEDLQAFLENSSLSYDYYDNVTWVPDLATPCAVSINYWVLFALALFMFLLSVLGNLTVVCVFCAYRGACKGADVLMLVFCFVCMLASLAHVLEIAHALYTMPGSMLLCVVFTLFVSATDFSIVFMLMIISIHRCLLVMTPNRLALNSRCFGVCLACFAVMLAIGAAVGETVFVKTLDMSQIISQGAFICAMEVGGSTRVSVRMAQQFLGIWLPVLVIIVCFILVVCRVRRMRMGRKYRIYFSFICTTILFLTFCVPGKLVALADEAVRVGWTQETCEIRTRLATLKTAGVIMESLFCALVTLITSLFGSLFKKRMSESVRRAVCRLSS